MLHTKVYRSGDLYGMFYHFGHSNDCVPMHDHARGRKHNVIVLRGAVEVRGHGWAVMLNVGDVFDFDETQYPHEIVARTDKTLILSVHLQGVHVDDVNMPDGHSGTIPDDVPSDPALIDQPQRSFKWKM